MFSNLAAEKEFKVQTRIISVDFGMQDVYPRISEALHGIEIGILGMYVHISFHCLTL